MSSLSLSYSLALDLFVCDRFRAIVLISMWKFGCWFKPLASAQIGPASWVQLSWKSACTLGFLSYWQCWANCLPHGISSLLPEPRQQGTVAGTERTSILREKERAAFWALAWHAGMETRLHVAVSELRPWIFIKFEGRSASALRILVLLILILRIKVFFSSYTSVYINLIYFGHSFI